MSIYNSISKSRKKQFAVLIDPDNYSPDEVANTASTAQEAGVDFLFIGGSLLTEDRLTGYIGIIRDNSSLPVIIFPGSVSQVNPDADAILLLSLISGRNAELLIGQHVIAAPMLKRSGLEILPVGYMLIENGDLTTALYMSHTTPIPYEKDDIAACTAMAGEMLGLKLIYMDAGSGASKPVSNSMISAVKTSIQVPLIIGGGIILPEQALQATRAGADIVVVGNAIEKEKTLIREIADAVSGL